MSDGSNDLKQAVARKGSFLQTLKAVFWSFFGVRKASDHAKDVEQLNPVHVIVAGILGGILFVLGLVMVVQWVVAQGVA
jgi:amino acid transporter